MTKPKTYKATHKGKAVKVTVPDDPCEHPLEDALRDNFSPQAIVAVAAHLFAANTKLPTVNRELRAFAELLVNTVGGTEPYNRLLKEVGL